MIALVSPAVGPARRRRARGGGRRCASRSAAGSRPRRRTTSSASACPPTEGAALVDAIRAAFGPPDAGAPRRRARGSARAVVLADGPRADPAAPAGAARAAGSSRTTPSSWRARSRAVVGSGCSWPGTSHGPYGSSWPSRRCTRDSLPSLDTLRALCEQVAPAGRSAAARRESRVRGGPLARRGACRPAWHALVGSLQPLLKPCAGRFVESTSRRGPSCRRSRVRSRPPSPPRPASRGRRPIHRSLRRSGRPSSRTR